DLFDVFEAQQRPAGGQSAARRANIAAEGGALTHQRLDRHGNPGSGGDDLGGLEGPGIGTCQQSLGPGARPQLRRRLGWAAAFGGQRRIRDVRIDAGAIEEDIPPRLPVPDEDHGRFPARKAPASMPLRLLFGPRLTMLPSEIPGMRPAMKIGPASVIYRNRPARSSRLTWGRPGGRNRTL